MTNPQEDAPGDPARGWELCDECESSIVPVTDPNDLGYYVHLHLEPEEVVKEPSPCQLLHKYLVAVLGEKLARPALACKHGARPRPIRH